MIGFRFERGDKNRDLLENLTIDQLMAPVFLLCIFHSQRLKK
jgi:hypothetical protein